jgi:dolichyl-phosphate-mannose--protein O-mannosyl transferase
MGVAPVHMFYSAWWRWPLLRMIWCRFGFENGNDFWAFGQPFVWTVGFVGTLIASACCLFWFWNGRLTRKRVVVGAFVVGYWASYLPFALVPRTIFFYHYIIPAIFSGFVTFAFLDQLKNRFCAGFLITMLAALAVVGFVYWSGFVYGLPIEDIRDRQWMKSWQS